MLILEGNVPYEAEALSDAAFLHTLVRLSEGESSRRKVKNGDGDI
jgi:hypothetical protein